MAFRKGLRQNRKRGQKIKAVLRLISLIMLIVFSATGAYYGISFSYAYLQKSSIFSIRNIEVKGIKRIKEQWVLNEIPVRLGDNLMAIDKGAIRERILKNPWIKDAVIRPSFPHTLSIRIIERAPICYMRSAKDCYLIDDSGKVFKRAKQEEITGLLEVKGIKNIKAGISEGNTAFLKELLTLIRKKGKMLCEQNVESIALKGKQLILTTKRSKIPLIFSLDVPIATQFRRGERIIYHLYSSGKYNEVKKVELFMGKDKAVAYLKKV